MTTGTQARMPSAEEVLRGWPEDEAGVARQVIGKYGEPNEVTPSMLVWRGRGAWKEMRAYREGWHHEFPFPHSDSFECIAEYAVPPDKFTPLARFDGSVTAWRTRGWLSATCHDEEANFLAVNLAHDIVVGDKSVEEARAAYVEAMIDYRAKKPTPYMEALQFAPKPSSGDPDEAATTAEELRERARERRGR